jgi:hypothetical protein
MSNETSEARERSVKENIRLAIELLNVMAKQLDASPLTGEPCGKLGCGKPATHKAHGSLTYHACDEHSPEIERLCESEDSITPAAPMGEQRYEIIGDDDHPVVVKRREKPPRFCDQCGQALNPPGEPPTGEAPCWKCGWPVVWDELPTPTAPPAASETNFDPATKINHLAAEHLGRIFGSKEKEQVQAIINEAVRHEVTNFDFDELLFLAWTKASQFLHKVTIEGMLGSVSTAPPAATGNIYAYLESLTDQEYRKLCEAVEKAPRPTVELKPVAPPAALDAAASVGLDLPNETGIWFDYAGNMWRISTVDSNMTEIGRDGHFGTTHHLSRATRGGWSRAIPSTEATALREEISRLKSARDALASEFARVSATIDKCGGSVLQDNCEFIEQQAARITALSTALRESIEIFERVCNQRPRK